MRVHSVHVCKSVRAFIIFIIINLTIYISYFVYGWKFILHTF